MAKKKERKVAPEPEKLSPLEARLKQMDTENAQLKKVLQEQEQALERMSKLEAMKRLRLNEASYTGANVSDDDDSDEIPEEEEPKEPESRQDSMVRKNSAFESTLRSFTESGEEGSIDVFRVKDDGQHSRMGSCPVKNWEGSLEKIAKTYGGGEFIVYLRDVNGQIAGKTKVIYDEEVYPKPTAQSKQVQDNPIDITALMQTMEERREKQNDKFYGLLTALVTRPAPVIPPTPASPFSSLDDILKIMAILKPQEQKQSNPLSEINNLLTVFNKGIEAGSSVSGGGGEKDDILLDIFKAFAPAAVAGMVGNRAPKSPIGEAMDSIQQKLVANQNPPSVSPEVTAEIVENKEEREVPMNPILKMAINTYKPTVVQWAKECMEPMTAAREILGSIPENYYPQTLEFLKRDDRLVISAQYVPEVDTYRGWVNQVMSGMIEILNDFFSTEESSAGEEEKPEEKKEEKKEDQEK